MGEKSTRHQGYSLAVFINFEEILDLLKIHSNICCGSDECSVEVSAKYFASDYLGDVLKYR